MEGNLTQAIEDGRVEEWKSEMLKKILYSWLFFLATGCAIGYFFPRVI